MKVRCWGARGSITVSGQEHVRYGGDTSCLEIRSRDGDILVLDAGTGIRALGAALAAEGCRTLTLLLSHYHWDHIQGLPFFRPLYDPGVRIAMGGGTGARRTLLRQLAQAISPPLFPVPFDKVPAQISPLSFTSDALHAGGFSVRRIPLSHPDGGAGFRIEADGASLVYLTDNELSLCHKGGRGFEDYAAFCRGADLLIHDAQYTPEEYPQRRGWGHSHIEDATRLAREAGVGVLGLFHHDQDRDDEGLDGLLERCRSLLGQPGDPACVALATGWSMDLGR